MAAVGMNEPRIVIERTIAHGGSRYCYFCLSPASQNLPVFSFGYLLYLQQYLSPGPRPRDLVMI